MWHLLEGGAYFNVDTQRCCAYLSSGAYLGKYGGKRSNRFMHNTEQWPNILWRYCIVHNKRVKDVWGFFSMLEWRSAWKRPSWHILALVKWRQTLHAVHFISVKYADGSLELLNSFNFFVIYRLDANILVRAEAYSEPCQISKIELLAKS